MISIDDNIRNKIQIIRAAAIFMVIVTHTVPLGIEAVFYKILGTSAVALFIFLSGLLTPFHIDDVKNFYKKRILRVLIPYIIWTAIYTITSYVTGHVHGNFLGKFSYNIVTAQSAIHLYFIFVYIQLVLVAPFVENLYNSRYKNLGFIIPFVSSILVLYIPCVITQKYNIWYLYPFTTWFGFYYLGMLMSNNKIQINIINKTFFHFFAILSVLLQIAEGYIFYNFNLYIALSQLKLSCIITSFVLCLYSYKYITGSVKLSLGNIFNKFVISIGNYSFGIYLMHILVINIFNDTKIIDKNEIPFLLYAIIVLLLTYTIIFILAKISGKNVSKRLGFI